MRPCISDELCEKCGECIDLCPYDVFGAEANGIVVAYPEDCIECAACVENCMYNAIKMSD